MISKRFRAGFLALAITAVSALNCTAVFAAQSDPLNTKDVKITNNARANDTIYVMGLAPGDEVYVYSYSTYSDGKLLAKQKAGAGKTDLTVTLSQLGTDAGYLYLSVKTPGFTESARIKCSFTAEKSSLAPFASDVAVVNKSGSADSITVTNLMDKDAVKVYSAATEGRVLASGTVKSGKDSITMTVSQLGAAGGTIYISVTSTGMNESARTAVTFESELQSLKPDISSIAVTNNVGAKDVVEVQSLIPGDIVTVYGADGVQLGTATCGTNKSEVTVNISQLGSKSGKILISVKSTGKLESGRTELAFPAEGITASITESNAIVTNNVGAAKDVIYVTGLNSGDTVKVYATEKDATVLAQGQVASGSVDVTITVPQLGTAAGSVWLTNTGKNMLLSEKRTQINYLGEQMTSAPYSSNIVVTNNSGSADSVEVSKCVEGDKITVYRDQIGNNILGTAVVPAGTTIGKVSISQLGMTGGVIYVSLTGSGSNESTRTKAEYPSETASATIDSSNVYIINNARDSDTVRVAGISEGDKITVYSKSGTSLGSATASNSESSVIITVSQLGSEAGSVFIARTQKNKSESNRVECQYAAEIPSDAVPIGNVTISNNARDSDTIRVTGISEGDKIAVYSKNLTALGSATVANSESSVIISVSQLGVDAGSVYITRTQKSKSESIRVECQYAAEIPSETVLAGNITVSNNAGIADTILVTGRASGDVINVYKNADGSVKLGSGTVPSGDNKAAISISQLGSSSGNIYVTVTAEKRLESAATQRNYEAEAQSAGIDPLRVSIVNSAGIASSFTAEGLNSGDVVKVYDRSSAGTLLGSGSVAAYGSETAFSLSALGADGGTVYVTVTSTAKLESEPVAVSYSAKRVTAAPSTDSITVENNAGIADTITLYGLNKGDVVNVYNAAERGDLLGSATAAAMEATVSVNQLGASGGKAYVSVTSTGKLASSRTEVSFLAESQTGAPHAGDITVVNNAGSADTVTVTGLISGDTVKVYKDSTGGTALGTVTVTSDLTAVISVSQLGTAAGTVYVSVKNTGKTESDRTSAEFKPESPAPSPNNISVNNNAVVADIVSVTGLNENDVVKVYTAATGGALLGSATVLPGTSSVYVNIAQLSVGAGSVYVSVTVTGQTESARAKADYMAEQSSSGLYGGYVEIINSPEGTADKIVVTNLSASDVIRVYDAATGGNLLGSATVPSGGSSATVSLKQLGEGAGSVYISIASLGKTESARVKVDYPAE